MIIGNPEEDEPEILPALGSEEGCVPTAVEDEEGVKKMVDDEFEIPVVGKGLEVMKEEVGMVRGIVEGDTVGGETVGGETVGGETVGGET
ncbi:hypothetical protein BGX26_010545, partial [Mortierella sp. AD094]